MTTRRRFIIALTAFGQPQPTKTARLGWLSYLTAPDPAIGLLREGMAELAGSVVHRRDQP
jgi:hypothetical protein